MRSFLKYLLLFLAILATIFYYFHNTASGQAKVNNYLSEYLSKKSKEEIVVDYFNLDNYPTLNISMIINKTAKLKLQGIIKKETIDIDYHIKGDSLHLNKIVIEDRVDLKGKIDGLISTPHITGKGSIFDGVSNYDLIKTKDGVKDLRVDLKGADNQQILKFLKQKYSIEGRADIHAKISQYNPDKQEGRVSYNISNGKTEYEKRAISFELRSDVNIDNLKYKYNINLKSNIGKLKLIDGIYNQPQKSSFSKYTIYIKDLSKFQKELKHKYKGDLDVQGTLAYDNDQLKIIGDTSKFGGNIHFIYKESNLELKLNNVSLKKLLRSYNYPKLLTADLFGTINYTIKDRVAFFDTKLKNTRFVKTKMTDMVKKTTGIDMLKSTYNQSSFIGSYENSILSSTLKIDNKKDHLYLKDLKINSKTDRIKSKLEFKMQGQEIYGDIYGTVKDPKISVDMQRAIKYQLKQKIGNLLDEEDKKKLNKEIKQVKETLKEIDVDDVKSLLNSFF